jgi:subfamily B ATP-binding cassette protein MsbA
MPSLHGNVPPNQGTLSRIGRLLEGYHGYALLLFVVMLLAAIAEGLGLSLVLPLLSGMVGIEEQGSIFSRTLEGVVSLVPGGYRTEGLLVALVIAFFFKSLLMILHQGMGVNFAMKLRARWSTRIFEGYLSSPYGEMFKHKQGVFVSNIVIEPMRAAKSINMILELVSKLTLSVTLITMLLLTDWKITVMATLGGSVVLMLLRGAVHRYSVKFGKERVTLNQSVTADATEGIGAIKEIKIFGTFQRHLRQLKAKLQRYTKIHTKFTILSNLPGHVIEFVIILCIAIIMSYVHLTRNIALKDVFPFLGFFVLVSQRLLVYISFILSHRMKIASFVPSLNLIHDLIYRDKHREAVLEGTSLDGIKDDIVFKDVTFGYGEERPVFQHLNLTIPRGKITAVVGPSGIGKSTLADLILRLFDPKEGDILLNGENIRQFSLKSWRERIGYVNQEPYIFNTSVRENILMGNPYAKDRDLVKAAKMANIHDFIETLPKGYDSVVGDRGVKLSGGQRQRLAIARVIIREPDLFIFDEATSSLDSESERMIQASIESLSRSKTILIIAHRRSTLKNADIIYQVGQVGEVKIRDFASLEAES